MSAVDTVAFREMLEGPNAFYDAPDYVEKTKKELTQKELVPVAYTWNTGNDKAERVAIVAGLIFGAAAVVVGYRLLPTRNRPILAHAILMIGFGASLSLYFSVGKAAHQARAKLDVDSEWKYKRITVEVDGNKVDAMIMGRASTLGNRRWVVSPVLTIIDRSDLKEFLNEIQGNAIVFQPSLNPMIATKIQQVILKFLEDQERGLGAKEVIAFHHWVPHETLNPKIKYVFVQRYTLNVPEFWKKFLNYPGIHSKELSKKLQASEIMIHPADVEKTEEIHDSSKLRDGVFRAKNSLAKALLDDKECPKDNKVFIGVPKDQEIEPKFLAQTVERLLKA
jgi:hypothetical protein